LWKSEENLVDLHAAEMVQTPSFLAALGMTKFSGRPAGLSFRLPVCHSDFQFVIPSEARNPGVGYTVTAA
jgi:hypothetical protein